MIFLSKGNQDPYINLFANGCNASTVNSDEFVYEDSNDPIVLRGILKKKIIHKCWKDSRTFYYMDTGYFGNEITTQNPNGWKYWHRVVKNNLQHNDIIDRPDDRFQKFNKKINSWKKTGRKILIAAPDEKPMKFYGLNIDQWLNKTVETIKQHTNRPIEIRTRDKSRLNRTITKPFLEALNDDVFALVTFNSNAAVESIFQGIPAFTLSPVHAASPVSSQNLETIETPYYPNLDKVYKWGCHLAYGQFHVDEMRSGKVFDILQNS